MSWLSVPEKIFDIRLYPAEKAIKPVSVTDTLPQPTPAFQTRQHGDGRNSSVTTVGVRAVGGRGRSREWSGYITHPGRKGFATAS